MSGTDPKSKAGEEGPLVVIGGPTASGKSPLALALAEAFGGAIVNADSMQVYEELRIVTARPSPQDETRAPHHLYGFLPARERCSVGLWLGEAKRVAVAACEKGELPIVVGGTGFYLDALTRGISPIPDVPDEIRAEVQARCAGLGAEELHALAVDADPELARRLPPGDTQRLVRLIEVAEATGEPLSSWQRLPRRDAWGGPLLYLVVEPDRAHLYATCDARFDLMMAEGALDEVRALADLELASDLPAMRALGVPHLLRHLHGEASLEHAVMAAKTATRRYAKRQLTWFRHQAPMAKRLDTAAQAQQLVSARSQVERFLLTQKAPKA
jgi:tRNA dimethylallyltransferase